MIVPRIDLCTGCGRCEIACSFEFDSAYSRAASAIKVARIESLGLDLPVACVLCGRCVAACPNEALSMKDGRIVLDEESCDGCGTCETACPLGVIEIDEQPRFCTDCGRCIDACNVGALSRGDAFSRPDLPEDDEIRRLTPAEKRHDWALRFAPGLAWIREDDVRVYRQDTAR